MPYNGAGVWTRLYSWVNDAAANIKIRADRMDNEMNDMANGFSSVITKNGTTTITANLPMASFRHTGVGNAASRTDYASFGQVQDGKTAWADGGGTADAITANYSIPITALVDGQMCFVRATAANATTTPTFSPNALTARTIVKNGGQALAAGDIAGDGHELELRYDLANTRWELMNPKGSSVPFTPASASTPAYLDFAEDTDNGTNRVRVIAPATLAADVSATLPSATGTLVGTGDTSSVSTAMIANDAVTLAKIQNATANNRLIGSGASGSGADYAEISLGTGLSMVGNTLTPSDISPVKAWVNFNGTGTVAIRASSNVSSITDNGVGDYTVNFTSPLADANYAVMGSVGDYPSAGSTPRAVGVNSSTAPTASACRINVTAAGTGGVDEARISVVFVR